MKSIQCENDSRGDGLSADGIIRMFSEESQNEVGAPMFKTRRDFVCFAAALGFVSGRRRALSGNTTVAVDGRIFERDENSIDIHYALVLAATESLAALEPASEDNNVRVFEELINGGIDVIRDWIVKNPSDQFGDLILLDGLVEVGANQEERPADEAVEF